MAYLKKVTQMGRKGRWRDARAFMKTLPTDLRRALHAAVKEESNEFLEHAKRCIHTSGKSNKTRWAKNTAQTRMHKRGAKPLVDSGALLKSMRLQKLAYGKYGIVFKGSKGVSAAEMTKRAMMHEHGGIITQTLTREQQQAILLKNREASGKKKRSRNKGGFKVGGVMVTKIRKRSFLASTKRAHYKSKVANPRFMARVQKKLVKYQKLARIFSF